MTGYLLDTHVLQWWSSEPSRLSPIAASSISSADELGVAAITWVELAWLAHRDRLRHALPVRSWLRGLSEQVRTLSITPEIADIAASLPRSFPADPADRLIYATAVEHGWKLVTRDERLRAYNGPGDLTVW